MTSTLDILAMVVNSNNEIFTTESCEKFAAFCPPRLYVDQSSYEKYCQCDAYLPQKSLLTNSDTVQTVFKNRTKPMTVYAQHVLVKVSFEDYYGADPAAILLIRGETGREYYPVMVIDEYNVNCSLGLKSKHQTIYKVRDPYQSIYHLSQNDLICTIPLTRYLLTNYVCRLSQTIHVD